MLTFAPMRFCSDENVQELAVELVQLGFISEVSGFPLPTGSLRLSEVPFVRRMFNLPLPCVFRAISRGSHPFWKRPSQSSTAETVPSIL